MRSSEGVFYFGNDHRNVSSRATRPMRTKFAMENEVDEFYLHFARHLNPPLLELVDNLFPKFDILTQVTVNIK